MHVYRMVVDVGPTAVKHYASKLRQSGFRNVIEGTESVIGDVEAKDQLDAEIRTEDAMGIRIWSKPFGRKLRNNGEVMSVTDRQIRELRTEAVAAGDHAMARTCESALRGVAAARKRCVEAINAARAMVDNKSMTYGKMPTMAQFRAHLRTFWFDGDQESITDDISPVFTMELVGKAAEVAHHAADAVPGVTMRHGRKMRVDFEDIASLHEFLVSLAHHLEDGDEDAGDLASAMMTRLGYEWI